jgi:putative ABC transport system permease protein
MLTGVAGASAAAVGVSAFLTMLITVLFMRMLVAKDRYPIAILKSMGDTYRDIRRQYLTRSVIVLMLGVVAGAVLANTLGEGVGVAIVSSFGATAFHFVINPWFAYLISPLLIAGCAVAATLLGVSGAKAIKIPEYIKEA